jgi:uncharacterized protein YfaS (alpha-2-macroglobulin family)
MQLSLLPFTWFRQSFASLARAVVGDLSWRPPGWARACGRGVKRRPVLSSSVAVVLIAALITGLVFWNWYLHQPKPTTVDWAINVPQPSQGAGYGYQNGPLTLTFDRSAARLESIGRDVSKEAKLSPKLEGKWVWSNESQLVFYPAQPWPADTVFQITLTKGLFSRHARIATLTKSFRSAPFTASINDLMFYVNPKDPTIKQVTATLRFSYPVDHSSLEKNLELAMESGANVFSGAPNPTGRCAITYDPNAPDFVAYVRSVNIEVPKQESGHAILTLPTSVITTAGGANLDEEQSSDVLIPATPDLFRFTSAQATIVTNLQDEPEQALILNSSVGVKPELLAKAIHAWILPRQKPGVSDDPYNWRTAAEVEPKLLTPANAIALTLVPSEQEFATLHSFKLKVPENAYLYIQVDQGLAAVGGFTLSDNFTSVSQMPPYPRAVRIMHDGSLLALSGERKLSILSRGVEQLEFRLQRVTPASINHLVSQSQGNFQSPIFNNDNFDESNITEQTIRQQTLAATDTTKNDYSALDFSEFVDGSDANQGKLGLFILRVLGRQAGPTGGYYKQDGGVIPAPVRNPSFDQYGNLNPDPADTDGILVDRRLILVTDLGLIVKDNADGTHDVFVQSIKTGAPVDGAKVDVLGKNGIPVVTAETDDNGHAALPSLHDFVREKEPVAYVVRRDNDVSFLPFGREDRELNFSRFDTSGLSGLAPADLTAFVFTDRGIYRPGDEAKLGLIIKQHNWQGNLEGVPLRLDIIDPRGTTVQSRVLPLNAGGFLETTYATRETSLTGRYQINCYLVRSGDGDDTLLGSETLKVAEFLPDRMKIKATLSATSPDGWISATGLTANVALANLYGAPAIGHRMKGKITLDPSQFSFEKYPDYSFVDPGLRPGERRAHDEDLPEQMTNDAGKATFDLSLANLEPSAYHLSFLAEGFEKEGGRSVTAGAEVLVSPRAWLVGCKPDGARPTSSRSIRNSSRLRSSA